MVKCIRVYCDPIHITQNQEKLESVQDSISLLSSALCLAGNEVRLKILFLIYEDQQLCVCDISDVLKMTMPAVSQHLKKLKQGNVLVHKKVGQTIFYSLTDEYKELFKEFFKMIKNNNVFEAV